MNKRLFLQEQPKLSKPGSFRTLHSLKCGCFLSFVFIYTSVIPWVASSMLLVSEDRFLLIKHQRLDINKSTLFILKRDISFRDFCFLRSMHWAIAPPNMYFFSFFYERPPHCQTSNTTSQMARTVSMFSRENRFKSFLAVLTWGLFQSNLWLQFNDLQGFYWKGIFITMHRCVSPRSLPAGWCPRSWTIIRSLVKE